MKTINFNFKVLLSYSGYEDIVPELLKQVKLLEGLYPNLSVKFNYNGIYDGFIVTVNVDISYDKVFSYVIDSQIDRNEIEPNKNYMRYNLHQKYQKICRYYDGISYFSLYRTYNLMSLIDDKSDTHINDMLLIKSFIDVLKRILIHLFGELNISYKFANDFFGKDIACKFKNDMYSELTLIQEDDEANNILKTKPIY